MTENEIKLLPEELVECAQAMKKLADFGAWCAREFRDTLGDVDGGSAQEAMERCGVLVKRTVTEPRERRPRHGFGSHLGCRRGNGGAERAA